MKEQLEIMNQQFKELLSIYKDFASQCGVSESEFWVLYALIILGGEYTQQDICKMWSLPKQTINSVIKSFVNKEYVYLEAAPDYGKTKIIHLTDEGKKFGENIVLNVYQTEKNALDKMTDEERSLCITLLGKYIHLLKTEIHNQREEFSYEEK